MQLEFVRGKSIKIEQRTLPADYYNKLHLIFAHSPDKQVFVPVRSMQYLAVIDKEEVIFVDGIFKQHIVLSWNHFNPHKRESLSEPVEYQCSYYEQDSIGIMLRLHGAFLEALEQLEKKQPKPHSSPVTSIFENQDK